MKIVAIIQTRTGSKRFPKKVLKNILGKSIIDWVLQRTKKAKNLKNIILATTRLKRDDILESIAKKNRVQVYRGDEKNVLKRYFDAAKCFKADIIVRICADNPFIDPNQIDYLVKKFKNKNFEYAFNHQSRLNTNYADGFGAEILTFKTLEKIYFGAKSENQKEHVTKYIWDNLKKFKILPIKSPKKLAYPQFKFDINTPEDYKSIKNFTENFNIKINTRAEDIIKYKFIEKGE
jgi:spore coat polysaccharide biosynthesis protein SpsF